MMEIAAFLATVLLADTLLRPLYRRLPAPRWAMALRYRRRARVVTAAWTLTAVTLLALWLIGEQRGLLSGLLLLIWVGVPLAAFRLSIYLLRRPW